MPVPLRQEACRLRHRRGAGCDGPVACAGLSRGRRFEKGAVRGVVKGRRPADEVGGPRTQQCGDAKHSVKAPSAWRRWELQADKTAACGTQAKICFRGPVQLTVLRRWAGLPPVCRLRKRHMGCPHAKTMWA